MKVAFLLLVGLVGAIANPIVNVQPIVTAPVLATKSAPIITEPIITQPIVNVQPLVQPLVKTYRTFKTITTQPVMVNQPVVKTKTFLTTQPVVKTFLTQPVLTQPIISQPIVTAPVMSTKSSSLLSSPLLSGSTFNIFGADAEALKAESTAEATPTESIASEVTEQLNEQEQQDVDIAQTRRFDLRACRLNCERTRAMGRSRIECERRCATMRTMRESTDDNIDNNVEMIETPIVNNSSVNANENEIANENESESESESENESENENEVATNDADDDYQIMQKGGDVEIRHGGKGRGRGRRFGLKSCLRRCRQLRHKGKKGRRDDDDDEDEEGGERRHGQSLKKRCMRRCFKKFGKGKKGKGKGKGKGKKHVDRATKIVDQDVRVVA